MKDNIIFITMAEAKQPVFKEVKSKKWVLYGEDNKYPDYLLDVFNKSPKHGAIIKGKAKYIAGDGWTGGAEKIGVMGENLKAMTRKVAVDVEIFGGYYLEVVWNALGKLGSVRHVDYTKYRRDKSGLFFYRKNNWSDNKEEPEVIPAFMSLPDAQTGKQIFYYREYRPSVDTYAIPEYIAAMNYIESDIEVSRHTLNNAKSGFTPSKVINLNNGEPDTDDEKKAIERKMVKKYSGAEGWKFIVSFNKDKDSAVTVEDLGASDLTKEDFTVVDNLISGNIFVGHQITSPMLFGIRVEGQLGGSTEMKDAFDIFQNTYVSSKQQQIEETFQQLADFAGVQLGNIIPASVVPVKPAAPLPGALPVLGAPVTPGVQPSALPTLMSEHPETEQVSFFNELGVSREGYEIVKSRPFRFSSDVASEEISYQQFTEVVIEGIDARIIELLKSDPYLSADKIASVLRVPVADVEARIKSLARAGALVIDKTGADVKRTPSVTGDTGRTIEVGVKYSYEVKPNVGSEVIPTTRPFCRRLIELDRLYTRKEIETMSIRLGYNVFERKGGWWGDRPECRHQWVQNVVIKRK